MIKTCEIEKDSKKYTGDYKTCYNHEMRHNTDWCCKAGCRCKVAEKLENKED